MTVDVMLPMLLKATKAIYLQPFHPYLKLKVIQTLSNLHLFFVGSNFDGVREIKPAGRTTKCEY
jgi:hypothetical protein